ncbi:hypothetical protein ED562_00365 [Microcystis aeruginosa FACHB-524]|nr:hypothetical protein ED562_00365 [Microcystis aeruginosa FACHB-524]TRU12240.1 MAG: hypothetical protein EWV60_06220 [Microcystis sp. Msp_OC_L_20101000_S702]
MLKIVRSPRLSAPPLLRGAGGIPRLSAPPLLRGAGGIEGKIYRLLIRTTYLIACLGPLFALHF